MGLYESIQRSQNNIDELSGDLKDYLQKRKQADATNEFYDKLKGITAQNTVTAPDNAQQMPSQIPQQTQAAPRRNMNAPIQPMQAASAIPQNQIQTKTTTPDRMASLRQYLMQNPEKLNDPNVAPLIQQEFTLNSMLNPEPDLMALHPGEAAFNKRTGKKAFVAPPITRTETDKRVAETVDPDTHHKMVTMERPNGEQYVVDAGATIVPSHETPEHKSQESAKKKFRDEQAAEKEYAESFDVNKAKTELAADRDFAEIMKLPAGERAAALMNPNINPEKRQRYQMYLNYLKHSSGLEAATKELKDSGLRYDQATDDFVPIEKQSKKGGKPVAAKTQQPTPAPADTTGAPLDDLFN